MKELLAALMFFTRLPFWRIAKVPEKCFKRVVDYWPLVGWLTGGFRVCVLYVALLFFPLQIALLISIASRVLLTGALHEDGLADFFDGMGGGNGRENILAIMKDSHIGTYGVLGLILYFLFCFFALQSIPLPQLYWVLLSGDVWSKYCASQMINFLPYARKESEAKIKVIYERIPWWKNGLSFIFSFVTVVFISSDLRMAALAPCVVAFLLILFLRMKIKGYTGDCCGAVFLLCELSFYLMILPLL